LNSSVDEVKEHALIEDDGLIVFNVLATTMHLEAINLAKWRKV